MIPTFADDAHPVVDRLSRYLNQSRDGSDRVINLQSITDIRQALDLETHVRTGGLTGDTLISFVDTYLDYTTRLHHPRYMAHQVGVPHPAGAVAALIDGLTNNPMAIYEMGPGAAAIEFFVINYLLAKIGWQPMPEQVTQRLSHDHGGGVLTHGGSLANMTALLAARNHLDPSIRETGDTRDLVILAPESSHYIIAKAAGIIGIGERNVVHLPTDRLGRIIPEGMDAVYRDTRSKKKQIVALVANGCATGTGLYDPIDWIADFCRDRQIWYHIDGAHGACALFSRKMRPLMTGIEKADSVVLDAHKMLRTPALCAALLLKDARHLDLAFEHTASYLFHDKFQPGFDFIQQTVECTKAGLGLKFYFSLAALGETGMENYLDQACRLTREAYEYIRAQKDFSCPYVPESNILCFRINGPDALQIRIRDRLIEQGSFHISSTMLNGLRHLRIVIISPATTREDITHLIQCIKGIAAQHA